MIRRAALRIRFDVPSLAAAVGLLLLLPASDGPAAGARGSPPPTSIELQPSRRSDLDNIELEMSDPRQSRSPRRAVTDLLVVLLPGPSPLNRALEDWVGTGPAAERRLFRARITAVSGGRLHRVPTAWCSSFKSGLSVCDVECDGGRFTLRRSAQSDGTFALGLGAAANGDGSEETGIGATAGIALTACSLDSAADMRLVARNGRHADIALRAD